MRRFEKPGRFWQAEVTGATLHQRWGDLGTPGRVFERAYGDAAAANAKLVELTATRTGEGYVEVAAPEVARVEQDWASVLAPASPVDEEESPPPAPQPAVARSPELEALCRAAIDDPAPWAIYADWLIAHDDPTGEVAALRVRGRDDAAERVFSRRGAHLFGAHVVLLRECARDLAWRHGFLVGATLRRDRQAEESLALITRALLDLPVARFVDSLCFGDDPDHDQWKPAFAALLASAQAAHLRELVVSGGGSAYVGGAPVADAWARLPALEHVELQCGETRLGKLHLPRLRTFIRDSPGLHRHELDAIHAARWPLLERLELDLGSRADGCAFEADDLRRILHGDRVPRLAHLALRGCDLLAGSFDLIADSPLLPQLRTLDLTGGTLGTRGAALLIDRAAAFRHLEWIDVRDNLVPTAVVTELRAALPAVRAIPQRDDDDI